MSARRQPMIWIITTAGKKRQSVWWDERADAVSVVEGRATDDSMLVLIYTLDEGDDPFDEAVWPKANPNLGVSVSVDFLREQAAKAKRSPGKLAAYLQLRMNIPTQQAVKAIDIDEWDANDGSGSTRPDRRGLRGVLGSSASSRRGAVGFGGLDLASVRDLTALIDVVPRRRGFVDVLCRFYCPEDGVADRSRTTACPTPTGSATATSSPRRATSPTTSTSAENSARPRPTADRDHRDRLRPLERDAARDRAHRRRRDLHRDPPDPRRARPGWRELERLILEGKLRHGGHPILRWMAGNVEVETDAAGNQKPSKAKSSERIDGIVALNMAIARVGRPGQPQRRARPDDDLALRRPPRLDDQPGPEGHHPQGRRPVVPRVRQARLAHQPQPARPDLHANDYFAQVALSLLSTATTSSRSTPTSSIRRCSRSSTRRSST
jgi:hypothetical protein